MKCVFPIRKGLENPPKNPVNTRKKGEITHFNYQTLNLGNFFCFPNDSLEIWCAGVKWHGGFLSYMCLEIWIVFSYSRKTENLAAILDFRPEKIPLPL